jgi:hypothetical protein
MGWRRYKGDDRNFSTIPHRTYKKWGDGRFFDKMKICILCKKSYRVSSDKSLYCPKCKKEQNLR